MNKFLLFTTGGGFSDPMNYDSSETALYSVSDLKGIKPTSKSNIEMLFKTVNGNEVVTLTIVGGSQVRVIKAISEAITSGVDPLVRVADMNNDYFIDKNIIGVSIKMQESFIQKITANTKTKLNVPKSNFSSCLITNTDASAAVNCTLHLTSQLGSDIVDTGTNSNESDNAVTTSSVTLTVDGTTATSDVFLSEQVWKSDGTLFGICTAFNSGTEIVFGNGINQILANNDDLYVGTRYTLLNTISIPSSSVLKLESDEISFDNTKYNLYVTSGDSDGQLTFTFNY